MRRQYEVGKAQQWIDARIPDAYLYFTRVLSEWLTRDGPGDTDDEPLPGTVGERFEALWSIVRAHLLIVAIDLDEEDDAQVIFETLNARGTQLLPADLVKNYLFHMAELEKAPTEQLYENYWRQFDENFWRHAVRQGRLKWPRIDLFLQHYLTLKTSEEVPVGHIFGVFKYYTETSRPPAADSDPGKKHSLEHLKRYGGVFRKFYDAPAGSRAALFFERLATIDTATVFPFLLEAFRALDTPDGIQELETILVDLESFLVRRMICGLTVKNYNRLFLDLVQETERAGAVRSQTVRTHLLKFEGDSGRWPTNTELRRAFENQPFYHALTQAKQRMVLEALDAALEDGKTEPIKYPNRLTLEHLMPQAWHQHWPLANTDPGNSVAVQKATDRREALLHTIGNLTLLTNKLNPAVSNSGWSVKQPEIQKHSKLNLNRYFHDMPTWDEAQIEARSRVLFDLAKMVWPRPES